MKIYGIDFTSAPKRGKPIVCADAWIEANILHIEQFHRFIEFSAFMDFLTRSPVWIAGVDFPLGQSRKLIEDLLWGKTWAEYVQIVGQMSKSEFVETLNQYRQGRAVGDREHLRQTDKLAGAISPMKVYGVPVGKMFFEGAPRMLAAGFSILPCHLTTDPRIVIEIYPAIMAREFIGKQSYKADEKRKQTLEMQFLRQAMINRLQTSQFQEQYGFDLDISVPLAMECIEDPSGDTIDALFAAIQTTWAFQQPNCGVPATCDRLEGWICGKF